MKAKVYNGAVVFTQKDAAEILRLPPEKVYRQVRKTWFMEEGADFLVLRGRACAAFKEQYGIESRGAALILLTQAGLAKIKKYFKGKR